MIGSLLSFCILDLKLLWLIHPCLCFTLIKQSFTSVYMLMTLLSLAIPLLRSLIRSLLSIMLLNSRIWGLSPISWEFKSCHPDLVSLYVNLNMPLIFFIELKWRILNPLKLLTALTFVSLLLMVLLYLILLSIGVWWVPFNT